MASSRTRPADVQPEAPDHLRRDSCDHGLYDARPLNDIMAVQGAGYGGGPLVYANVAMHPPAKVFDDA